MNIVIDEFMGILSQISIVYYSLLLMVGISYVWKSGHVSVKELGILLLFFNLKVLHSHCTTNRR